MYPKHYSPMVAHCIQPAVCRDKRQFFVLQPCCCRQLEFSRLSCETCMLSTAVYGGEYSVIVVSSSCAAFQSTSEEALMSANVRTDFEHRADDGDDMAAQTVPLSIVLLLLLILPTRFRRLPHQSLIPSGNWSST